MELLECESKLEVEFKLGKSDFQIMGVEPATPIIRGISSTRGHLNKRISFKFYNLDFLKGGPTFKL